MEFVYVSVSVATNTKINMIILSILLVKALSV